MNIKARVLAIYPAFGERNYCLHFWGQLISSSCTWLQNIAMGWFAWELTHSESMTALIVATPRCVSACLTVFGGILSDKFDKRKVLYATNVLSMAQAMLLGYIAINQIASVNAIIVLSVILGLINAVDGPARHSFLPEIVGRDEIKQMSSFNFAMTQSAQFIGSSLAGLLLGLVGTGWTFFMNGLSFTAVIMTLSMMEMEKEANSHIREDSLEMFKKGMKYILSQPKIFLFLVFIGTQNFFGFSYRGILPAASEQIFSSGAKNYAAFMACAGLGAVTGAILASAKSKAPLSLFMVGGCLVIGSALILFPALPFVTLGMLMMFMTGFGLTLSSSIVRGACQELISEDMRGRVNGFIMMFALGGTGLGGVLTGKLAEIWGCQLALMVNGTALVAIGLLVLGLIRSPKISMAK